MWTFLFLIFVLGAGLSLWEYAGRHLLRNIGEASYVVLERYKQYEVREYAPFLSAEVSVSGDVETAMNEGFSILSSYLSRLEGDDTSAPETIVRSKELESYAIAFALPSRYSTGNLPEADDSRITFRVVPGRIVAALRFRGVPSERYIKTKEALLRKFLKRDLHEPLDGDADADFVRLAPPYSMPISATNEIIIDIE